MTNLVKLGYAIIESTNHNRYEITKVLGNSGQSSVFQVRNQKTKIIYALKRYEELGIQEQIIIQQLVNKQFSNLVNVVEYYQSARDKCFYIVMEYCDSDLSQQLQRETIQEEDIRYIMIQIATGIQQLHSQNIIHRDIKPENILIQNLQNAQGLTQKIYKICDFGLSKQASITQTINQGTLNYLSPEQLKPGNQYTNSVDIWAFGAVIYELLMKKPLFDGQTQEEVYQKIKNQDINKLLSTILKSQLQYQALLMRMLDRDPLKRPKIDEVIQKLQPTIISRGLSPPLLPITIKPKPQLGQLQLQQHYYHDQQHHLQQMPLIQNQFPQTTQNINGIDKNLIRQFNSPEPKKLQQQQHQTTNNKNNMINNFNQNQMQFNSEEKNSLNIDITAVKPKLSPKQNKLNTKITFQQLQRQPSPLVNNPVSLQAQNQRNVTPPIRLYKQFDKNKNQFNPKQNGQ